MVEENNKIQGDDEVARELSRLLKEDSEMINKLKEDENWTVKTEGAKKLIAKMNFEEMGLSKDLLKAIYEMGYEKPSFIQSFAIPKILAGGNLVFQSKSGTGKTIAFVSGILNRIKQNGGTQALVITPTRELNQQVGEIILKLGSALGIKCFTAVKKKMVTGLIEDEVAIGSPGSILRLIRCNNLDTSKICITVIDEADAVLDVDGMGSQTQGILNSIRNSQKVFFSATYSERIKELIEINAPRAEVFYESENSKPDEIKLYYMEVNRNEKIKTLLELYENLQIGQLIVFVATKHMVNTLKNALESDMHIVSCVHGDMEADEREMIVNKFKNAETKVLISTDIFSRGMDIPQVNLVINFDLPVYQDVLNIKTYIHRVGRTGRFGRYGFVIDFISGERDFRHLMEIQKELKCTSKKFTLNSLKKIFLGDNMDN